MTRATICGNYVVLKLGEAEYALFAHLKPGGIKVKPGERVKRGDVLGYIGNTGNSDAPHLHFHAMSGPSPLASEGIPYVFPQFTILSVLAASDLDAMLSTGKAPSPPQPPLEPIRNHEMPKGNMVLGVP
jgi:murein DD-endopeptidase MepM/ murein hydrolase activator NlpD